MSTIVIIIVGVVSMGAMIGLDAFISKDLEKPVKEKKNTDVKS